MLTTVPPPRVAGTSLRGGMEAAAEGGWRGNTQAGAERGRSSMAADATLPLFSKPNSSPAFQAAEEPVVPHQCPSWRKKKKTPKGGVYLPARRLPGAGMLSLPPLPTSCTSTPLSASTALALGGARSTFLWAL